MNPWLALTIAIISNVTANVTLKYAMITGGEKLINGDIVGFLNQPWPWIGGLSCVVLLGSYLVAIKNIGLGTSYAMVTTLALVIITITAAFIFNERITGLKVVGITLILSGLFIIIKSEVST